MIKPTIMFIHGFMGNPIEFDLIKEMLNDNDYQTHSFYLHGHKERVKKITKEDWLFDCQKNLDYLVANNQKIIIIGHSLGGVLGINLALNNPQNVQKLILIDPAIEYLVNENGRLKVISSLRQISKAFKQIDPKKQNYKPIKLPLSAFKEFRKLIKEEINSIYNLKCPLLVLQGECDYIVLTARIKEIYAKLNNQEKDIMVVPNASHWWLREPLTEKTKEKILSFIKK